MEIPLSSERMSGPKRMIKYAGKSKKSRGKRLLKAKVFKKRSICISSSVEISVSSSVNAGRIEPPERPISNNLNKATRCGVNLYVFSV